MSNVPGISILRLMRAFRERERERESEKERERERERENILCPQVSNVPGISILRLMRAFRVLRLFARLKSLRQAPVIYLFKIYYTMYM